MRVTQTKVRRRIFFVLLAMVCVVSLLMGRLVHVTLIAAADWDRLYRTVPVKAVRGEILDDNGQPLVYTASASTLIIVPQQIKDKRRTAQLLAPIIGAPQARLLKLMSKRILMEYIKPWGVQLDDAKTRAIRALRLPGVYLTEEGRRTYPYGTMLASVLGVTGGDGQGLSGVELTFNRYLTGKPGAIRFVANARGDEIPGTNDVYVAPVPGDDVELTIDKQIQQFAEREIANIVSQYAPDHVTIVVANPKTGQILAMANYPSFNPVNWRKIPQEVYNRNLAIWQTFEPGSTFKIVTLSAALQEKKVTLKEGFYDPGYYEVAGHRIRCWKKGGHGKQTYLNVVENSCNPGFIQLGERLGAKTLNSFVKGFGFGKKTGIALPGESRGILFSPSRVGPLELATTSFGQGVSVTPIQQVMAISAIANGGVLMKPLIVRAILDGTTGKVIQTFAPEAVRRVISPDVAAEVRSALESVVAQGTGGNAFREGYRIGGKTGTAQVVENGHYSGQHYIVSFIGMAPSNDPQVVAYVAIDYPRPKGTPVFGGVIAAPVIGSVLADSLQYMGVPPSTTGIAKKYRFGIDPVLTPVPDLARRSYQDAVRAVVQSGSLLRLAVVGEGPYVVAQAPVAGTKIPQGSLVRIFLGPTPPP
ncbi:MAG: penicillin-binding transpeptidase domain-containing protein [Firmicutes bacterium]|nr:penicillin-binding transpeptidase domain-containing protein [Bacillota bacterium]